LKKRHVFFLPLSTVKNIDKPKTTLDFSGGPGKKPPHTQTHLPLMGPLTVGWSVTLCVWRRVPPLSRARFSAKRGPPLPVKTSGPSAAHEFFLSPRHAYCARSPPSALIRALGRIFLFRRRPETLLFSWFAGDPAPLFFFLVPGGDPWAPPRHGPTCFNPTRLFLPLCKINDI